MIYSNRQIEIIKAATELIGSKGIQNLTTKNLAAKIGFSEPALYRHFKNKTEILASILAYYKESLKEGVQRIITEDSKGIDKLKNIQNFQFKHFSENPAIVMVIFAETSFQFDTLLSGSVLSILNQKQAFVEKVIHEGQDDGSIRDDVSKEMLATMFMGSMRFTILRWRLNNYEFNLQNEGQELWKANSKMLSKKI